MDKDDPIRPYAVGYGQPPVHSRFKKGSSGNSRGSQRKEKGPRNLQAEILNELGQKVAVTENGKRRHLARQTVLAKRLVADALKGDAKARDQLLRLINQAKMAPQAETSDPIGTAKDEEILARYRAELIAEHEESKK